MSRLLPYPLLTAGLLLMWLMLTSFTTGQLVLGLVLSVSASAAMAALQPSKPRLRRWRLIPRLMAMVAVDIIRSNAAVATLIVRRGGRPDRVSGFVTIPLQLRDRTGLAILACIITSTPGTAWVEYAPEPNVLVIHVLDLLSEEEWVELIKTRYEAMLLEIFE